MAKASDLGSSKRQNAQAASSELSTTVRVSISRRSLILYNTRSDILLYIRDLLSKLNIETTELHFGTKAGTELVDPLNGKTYIRNSDCFTLRIRARSLPASVRERCWVYDCSKATDAC